MNPFYLTVGSIMLIWLVIALAVTLIRIGCEIDVSTPEQDEERLAWLMNDSIGFAFWFTQVVMVIAIYGCWALLLSHRM